MLSEHAWSRWRAEINLTHDVSEEHGPVRSPGKTFTLPSVDESVKVLSVPPNTTPAHLRPAGSFSDELHVASSKLCFFVKSTLYGNHSSQRANAAMSWYKNVTLRSISHASAQLPIGVPVIAAISLQDAYVKFGNDTFVDSGHEHMLTVHSGAEYRSGLQHTADQCAHVVFVRIDADDMLSESSFAQLYDVMWPRVSDNRTVVVAGTHLLSTVAFNKVDETVHCDVSVQTRSSFFSAGLSIGMSTSQWHRDFHEALDFGQHDFILDKARKLVTDEEQIEEVPLTKLAYYLESPLSGHYEMSHVAARHMHVCTFDALALTMAEADARRLSDAAQKHFPALNRLQVLENNFLVPKAH